MPTPTSTRPTTRPSLFLVAAVAALGWGGIAMLMPSRALAAGATHTTLADFQQNIRADYIVEPFNGADSNGVPPIVVSGNGYAYTVDAFGFGLIRFAAVGVGNASPTPGTRFTFTGKPVSAFGGTFRVANGSLASVGGTISIVTNTGETANLIVNPGAGSFFAITTTQPFTSVTFDTVPPGVNFEFIDDAYVGTSGTAAAASDQCADAQTITPTTAAVYPFTTVGATAAASPGVCDGAVDTGPDVWFRYVAPLHGTVVFNTCGCTFDSILRVFASCAAAPLGANIACNDDFCTGGGVGLNRASQVSFRVIAGEDYLIRISGYNGATGSGNLNFSFVPDCTADFNHSGGKEVQDIFDFLTAWFGAC